MHRNKIAFFIISFLVLHQSQAQSIAPHGQFMQDRAKIGEEVTFTLAVSYDKRLNLIFPDSTYHYGTFDYNSRKYFRTKSDSVNSYDSVVYYLSTYEIDTTQYLQLPVFVVNGEDSLAILSDIDSIRLVHVVTEIPEQPELKANASFIEVKKQFNYPYFLIGLGIIAFFILVIALFFGKDIAKLWKVYRMNRIHKRFTKRFFNLMRDVSSNNPQKSPEHVLAVWKRYMERLERQPISKLTTKEILVLHNDSALKENLRTIDRNIYGGERSSNLFASFDYLMKFSVNIFHRRIEEIKSS